jgi:hypothetical protein
MSGKLSSNVWYGVESIFVDRSRAGFVPKGLSDSSLAVYCQEYRTKRIRPGGDGMIGKQVHSTPLSDEYACRPNHTVPYGTSRLFERIPGNKLSGCDHLVPSGQKPQTFVHVFEQHHKSVSKSRTRTTTSTRTISSALRRQPTINREGDSGNEPRRGGGEPEYGICDLFRSTKTTHRMCKE